MPDLRGLRRPFFPRVCRASVPDCISVWREARRSGILARRSLVVAMLSWIGRAGESGRDAWAYAACAALPSKFTLVPEPFILIRSRDKAGFDRIVERIIKLLGIIFVVTQDVIVCLILPNR